MPERSMRSRCAKPCAQALNPGVIHQLTETAAAGDNIPLFAEPTFLVPMRAGFGGEDLRGTHAPVQAQRVHDDLRMVALHATDKLRGEDQRSEEHTSELQSRPHLVCR